MLIFNGLKIFFYSTESAEKRGFAAHTSDIKNQTSDILNYRLPLASCSYSMVSNIFFIAQSQQRKRGFAAHTSDIKKSDIRHFKLQVTPCFLLMFNGFEQCLKISFAETPGSFTLNDLEKQGRSVFYRFCKYLQQVALFVTVNQNAQLL